MFRSLRFMPATPLNKTSEHYLRLVFANEDAAYYQFPVFPNFSADYIVGVGRKRAGASQYIRLELSRADFLQAFIGDCRSNPHLIRIDEASADEFLRAPSNAV